MCNFYIYIYYWQIVICYNISKLDESRRHINIYIYKYYGCTCIQSVLLELRIIRTIVHIITPFENLTSSRYKISRICIVVDSVRSCFPFLFLFFFFNSSHLIFNRNACTLSQIRIVYLIVHTHYIQISNREIVMIFSRAKNIRDKTSKRDESHA